MKRFYILLSFMLLMLIPMSFMALNTSVSISTLENALSQNIFFPVVYLAVGLSSLIMFIIMFLKKSKDYVRMALFLLIIIGFIYSFDIIKISFYSLFANTTALSSLMNGKDETTILAKSISQLSTIFLSGMLGSFLLIEQYKQEYIQKENKDRILGLLIGTSLLLSVFFFLRSYYLFVSLYSKVDFNNILSYQIKRLQYIGILTQSSRVFFMIAFVLMIIYEGISLREKKEKPILIFGLLMIILMIFSFPFLTRLNNIHSFSVDITKIKAEYLIQKYDYLYSLLNVSTGYNTLISQSGLFFTNGLLAMIMISLHIPYFEEELFTKDLLKWVPRFIGIVLAIVVIISSISYFKHATTYTDVDLVKNISFSYEGDSGEAKIVKFKSNLTSNDDNVKSFLSTVTYNYKEMTSLSNGDRITIKAQYSKEKAKELRINVLNDERTFTVSGLVYRFDSSSKIPSEIKTAMKNDATASFESYYNNQVRHDPSAYSYSLSKMYFAKDQISKDDKAIIVFKIEHSYTSFYFIPRKETYYLYTYASHIKSDYLKKKPSFVVSSTKLQTQLFYQDDIKSLVQNEFRNYSLEEFS